MGKEKKALAAYEHLIRDELVAKNDLEVLVLIISRYRQYLTLMLPWKKPTADSWILFHRT